MYYAATNFYATATSRGFANTWQVLAFRSRSARDQFVANATDLATHSITKSEICKFVARPKPFSGMARVIDTRQGGQGGSLIGVVTVDQPDRFFLPLGRL